MERLFSHSLDRACSKTGSFAQTSVSCSTVLQTVWGRLLACREGVLPQDAFTAYWFTEELAYARPVACGP